MCKAVCVNTSVYHSNGGYGVSRYISKNWQGGENATDSRESHKLQLYTQSNNRPLSLTWDKERGKEQEKESMQEYFVLSWDITQTPNFQKSFTVDGVVD